MSTASSSPSARYRLYGSIGSPYALKLRSLLRYRRLPFDWVPASLDWVPEGLERAPLVQIAREEIAGVRPPIIPIVRFHEDGNYVNDSTLIAMQLEERNPAVRSAIPPNPGWAFLSRVLEDMADEWGVKIAFNYRWGYRENREHKSRIVAGELLGGGFSEEAQLTAARHFANRQVGRMPLVGCTASNQPLIEATFHRLLAITGRIHEQHNFIFGSCATLADFGWYGQLASLATDPTPEAMIRASSPGTFQYLQMLEDASGIDGSWSTAPLPTAAIELLHLAGEVYFPFLRENARAVERGSQSFTFTAMGCAYTQSPFRYQAKCYQWLRDEYAELPSHHRAEIDPILKMTGCFEHLNS